MARKATREWTQVSNLVGRIQFSVGTGKDPKAKTFVPRTEGFIVEIVYDSAADRMYNALCNSVLAIQGAMRQYYCEHKHFPFAPGKVQRVKSDGTFVLPTTVYVDKIVAQAVVGELDIRSRIRLAKALGLKVPRKWCSASINDTSETNGVESKYNERHLRFQSLTTLRALAQSENLESYDELTRDELVKKLALIER